MKPTKGWYALILMIPTSIAASACFSLGHMNIFKYGFALIDLWSNLFI